MTRICPLSAGVAFLVSVGCSPKYYVPNTLNVPMIQARGRTSLDPCRNDNRVNSRAPAVSDSVAFQVNLGFVNPKDEEPPPR